MQIFLKDSGRIRQIMTTGSYRRKEGTSETVELYGREVDTISILPVPKNQVSVRNIPSNRQNDPVVIVASLRKHSIENFKPAASRCLPLFLFQAVSTCYWM